MSRRLGRRGTILLGSVGGAAAQLWFTLAAARPEWYLSRLLFGAFRGLLWPVLFAEVADVTPPGRHGRAFATFWLYFGVGLLAGPWIGGWLADAVNLRAPLFLSAGLALVPLLLGGTISARRDAPVSLGASLRTMLRRREVVSVWMLNTLHTTVYGLFSTFLPLSLAPIYLARAAAMAAIPLAHTFTGLLALNGLIGIVGAVRPGLS